MAVDTMELLFFDTFSHESNEELNLDLVQFPDPVYINEVRIIPLGTRVQADFPGGVRLGATNPSQFELEFFVNDLSKTGASTFEGLGSLEYKQNVDIQLTFKKKIPTDGLVLRGWYTTITIAIYGSISKIKERNSPPPPPPPQTTQKIRSGEKETADASIHPEWDRESQLETESIIQATTEQVAFPETQKHGQYPPDHPKPAYPEPRSAYPEHQSYEYDYPPVGRSWPTTGEHPPSTKDNFSKERNVYTRSSYSRDSYDEKKANWDHKDRDRESRDPRTQQREKEKPRDREYREPERVEFPTYDEREAENEPGWEKTSETMDKDLPADRIRFPDKEDELNPEPSIETDVRVRTVKSEAAKGETQRTDSKRPRTPPISSSPKRRPRTPPLPAENDPRLGRGPCSPPPPQQPPPPKDEIEPGEVSDDKVPVPSELFDPLTPDDSPEQTVDVLSDGEIHEGEGNDGGYSEFIYDEILSDEEFMSDGEERNLDMPDLYYEMSEDPWNYISSFNPYQCELTSLVYFSDPSLTPYEIEKKKMGCPPDENAMETAQKILKTVEYFEDKDHSEKWVEAMELLPSILVPGLVILRQSSELKGIVELLLDWLCDGLNFEKAVEQSQPVYKVRHIKAGIRLAIALCNCDNEIMHQLLEKNVQTKLLDLYEKEYMALSIKLLIIQALDASTRTEKGMKTFLRKHKPSGDIEQKSDYQRLLNLILSKQSSRATVAISALLKKIHVFEIISKFSSAVEKLVDNLAAFDISSIKPDLAKDSDNEQTNNTSTDNEIENFSVNYLNDNETENIISYLAEINKILGHAQLFIAQPKRFLPTKSQFEMLESPHDAYPGLYCLLKNNRFLETLFVLLSCPGVNSHLSLFDSVKDLLTTLMHSQHGLLFLLTQPDVMNGIIRLLTQSPDDGRDEASEEVPHQLGLQLVYHLQVLQYVDALLDFHSKDSSKKELDDPEALAVLQPLYTMVFVPIGRQVVVDVLSMEHNLNALVPFLELSGDEQNDIKIRKSASMGYATELLLVITHYSENVSLLKNFGEKLLNICTQESSSKLQEIVSWFSVMKRIPSYSADAIAPLCGIVKTLIEEILTFPGELITSVRILKDLCISSATNLKHEEQREELKYRYAIIQFIANDGLSNFITVLQKICDAYQYPYPQNYATIGPQWGLLLALIKPIVSLMKHSLCYLIYCRNAEYKDLVAVPIILRVSSFLSIIPITSSFYPMAQGIQNEIIEILLAYTQPIMTVSDSDETLNKSLWSQMLQDVLKFTTALPCNFLSGLVIISELLPLPLPIQTREPLSNDDILQATNARKLWSAHLHSMNNELRDIIKQFFGTSLPSLQQQLRRVCVQLADLSASSSLIVTRAIADVMLEYLEEKGPEDLGNAVLLNDTHTYRLLNMLDCLVNQPCIKMPLLQLLRANTKLDEKYVQLLPKLISLLNTVSSKTVHLQIQECIVSIFQSLCDYEIILGNENSLPSVDQLGNALPVKDQMILICSALLDLVSNTNQSFSTTILAFRTLIMILETDLGFYCLKLNFDKKPDTLHSIFNRCVTSFNKDNVDSIGTLNTCLDFVRLLYAEDSAQGVPRTLFFTTSELILYTQWKEKEEKDVEEDVSIHPLVKIEKTLQDFNKEDEAVDIQNMETVTTLIQQFNNESIKGDRAELPEPNFLQPDTLSTQFQMRAIYVVNETDDDRFSPTYWLLPTNTDDFDQDVELVQCDLENMAERYCSGLDLKSELGKDSITKDNLLPLNCKKKGVNSQGTSLGKRKYQPLINPGQKERNGKKPFIAPMRGRGFSRSGIHPSRANDPFRSRPPNTSRPPSMHVDDFVALETFHPSSVPTGPTNKRPSKDTGRGRGRGNFEGNRAFTNTRGRFLQSQQGGSYGSRRGDDKSGRGSNEWLNRSISRGNSGNVSPWNTRSNQLLSAKSTTKVNTNLPRNFPRGGSHLEPRAEMRTTPGNTRPQDAYGRFQRVRGGNTSGNWSRSRSKERADGRGRRDGNRHVRALTR